MVPRRRYVSILCKFGGFYGISYGRGVSRLFCALYQVAAELDTADLLGGISSRIRTAIAALLVSAANADFDDLPAVTFTLLGAMAGTTRAVFQRGAKPAMLRMLRIQLEMMCRGYLQTAANQSNDRAS